jgi:hypothetical protein
MLDTLAAQTFIVQQMSPIAIFDLDHPQVRIKATLLGNRFVDIGFGTFQQSRPNSVKISIIRSLKDTGLSIKGVQLDQHRARRGITLGRYKRWYLCQL